MWLKIKEHIEDTEEAADEIMKEWIQLGDPVVKSIEVKEQK